MDPLCVLSLEIPDTLTPLRRGLPVEGPAVTLGYHSGEALAVQKGWVVVCAFSDTRSEATRLVMSEISDAERCRDRRRADTRRRSEASPLIQTAPILSAGS